MKLGLVTDIHEQVELLRGALDRFKTEQVDQVVVIGDLLKMGQRIEETCRLLAEADAIGVWGNHDFGMCVDPSEEMRQRFPPAVFDFMTTLQPRLEIAGCHFSHVEPWLNPEDLFDLWYYDGPPDQASKLDRIFNAVPSRVMFAGHFHRWLLATPETITDWNGASPIRLLPDQRYFIVIGALCEGRYAVFDTDSSVLMPFNEN